MDWNLVIEEVWQAVAKRKGNMTVADAGRKGGQAVSSKYGHEFYEAIGRKGGEKVAQLVARAKRASQRES